MAPWVRCAHTIMGPVGPMGPMSRPLGPSGPLSPWGFMGNSCPLGLLCTHWFPWAYMGIYGPRGLLGLFGPQDPIDSMRTIGHRGSFRLYRSCGHIAPFWL